MAKIKNHGIRHVVQHKQADGVLRFVTIEGGDTVEVEDALAEKLVTDLPEHFSIIDAKGKPVSPAAVAGKAGE